MPAHERDAAVGEPRDLGGVVEVVDHLVATREHGRDVERPGRDPGDAARLGGEVDRAQQRLRGHARIEGALPADEALLHDRHLEPRLAQTPGEDLARRSGTDHDHVELALLHSPPPVVVSRV